MRGLRILEKCTGHWPVTGAFLISQTYFAITNMIVALEVACENSRPSSLLARVSEEGRLYKAYNKIIVICRLNSVGTMSIFIVQLKLRNLFPSGKSCTQPFMLRNSLYSHRKQASYNKIPCSLLKDKK